MPLVLRRLLAAAPAGLCHVRNLLLLLAALVLPLLLSACAAEPRTAGKTSVSHSAITRADVVADVDQAVALLSDMHPNLYWRATREEMEQRKQELLARLPESPSALDVYVTLMGLTSVFDDIHVAVATIPPQLNGADGKSLYDIYAEGGGPFPALFDPFADGLRVVTVTAPEQNLKAGDVIASINGVAASELLDRLEHLLPGSAATKRFEARREFGRMLWMLGAKAPFQVGLAASNGAAGSTLSVQPSTRRELAAITEDAGPDPIRYRLLDDGIALIGFYDMSESPDRFAKRLDEIFDRVQLDHPRGLAIDLRLNGGGHMGAVDLLLDHINDKPYRPYAERHWKVSRSCQQWYQAFDEEQRQYFSDYLSEQPGKTLVVRRSPERRAPTVMNLYDGPVAALIGPGTASSATILADAMKTYGLARVFGQPTTEPANMYGAVCQATLSHSGISITAPSALFIRANGDATSDGPIQPDVPVDGAMNGSTSDATLNAARLWLRTQAGT